VTLSLNCEPMAVAVAKKVDVLPATRGATLKV
jgi:hypothetical protein